ncbi:hypothetical protein MMC34_008693 [Xylographa carneopallida]|nr:hypothetical protein [Xylographa carneopallida]
MSDTAAQTGNPPFVTTPSSAPSLSFLPPRPSICFITVHRIQRTILTSIPSRAEYEQLDQLVQRLLCRRYLVPLAPDWPHCVPWREDCDVLNYICLSVLLLNSAAYCLGLLLSPFLSLGVLLCFPFAALAQSQLCLRCTGDYRGDSEQQQVVFEVKLQALAGYPIAYSSLDGVTEGVLSFLHARGVAQEQVWVRDGYSHAYQHPSGCATIPVSALSAAGVAALQAEEQQHTLPALQPRLQEMGNAPRTAFFRAVAASAFLLATTVGGLLHSQQQSSSNVHRVSVARY